MGAIDQTVDVSTDSDRLPTRAAIEARWAALLEGHATREEVHDWTVPWVEGMAVFEGEPLAMTGLQYLHGFDVSSPPGQPHLFGHGPGGTYRKSMDDIAADLEYWRTACSEYDRNPEQWLATRMRVARHAIDQERGTG